MIRHVNIYFFADNKRIATRNWLAVPRVGDEVMLDEEPFAVRRVVWGVEGVNEIELKIQAVSIELERLK